MQDNIQLTHSDHHATDKKYPLCIVASDINDPLNVGSLYRLCDALGISKLYLCGSTPVPPNTKLTRASRSTEKYVDYEYHADTAALVKTLKNTGSMIVSLEITTASISLDSDDFRQVLQNNQPVCLILGSENTGVSKALLSLSDVTVHIPMHGVNSSMNVITAASIASYEIIRHL